MRRTFALLLAALLFVSQAHAGSMTLLGAGKPPAAAPPAGIAFVNAADGGNNGGTTSSHTYSYSVGGGSNLLVVGVYIGGTPDILTSVTYNGVAMTLAGKILGPIGVSFPLWNYLYFLSSPATGAHNVVLTCSGTCFISGLSADYSGANTSGQPDAISTNSNTNNAITGSVTTIANNSWAILSYASNFNGGASTAGTGSTLRIAIGGAALYDSGAPITPAGSYSMSVNNFSGGGGDNSVVIGSFKP